MTSTNTHELLAQAREHLDRVRADAERLSAPQNTFADDPAVVSGIRRTLNARADARRHARHDREAQAWQAVRDAEAKVAGLERTIARNQTVPFTDDDLKSARFVRDRHGWHEVVKVNAKTVSVATGYSWVDRIPVAHVLEVRTGKAGR